MKLLITYCNAVGNLKDIWVSLNGRVIGNLIALHGCFKTIQMQSIFPFTVCLVLVFFGNTLLSYRL